MNGTVNVEAFENETGIDSETVKELYIGFMEEMQDESSKLHTQLAEMKMHELAQTVHNIKGVSGSYKAWVVFEHAKELDANMKAQDFSDIDAKVVKLAKAIVEAEDYLRNHFKL